MLTVGRSISHHNAALLFPSRVLYCFQPQHKGIRLPDSELVTPLDSFFTRVAPDCCVLRCVISVDMETTGVKCGGSGGNANGEPKACADGAGNSSDQFHWFDLSGEVHCLVNTPSLESTLITSPKGAVPVGHLSPVWCHAEC